MYFGTLPKAQVDVDTTTAADVTTQNSFNTVVSMEDPGVGTGKWVYVFYINSSGQLGFKKSADNGATYGTYQVVDAAPTTYTAVAVWYDRWTDISDQTGNLIHVIGANSTDQGLRYFTIDTDNTDTVGGDTVALSDTTIETDPFPSICVSFDGTIYVAATFTTTVGIQMADSADGSSWNDRGVVLGGSHITGDGKLFPAKTDNDVMMLFRNVSASPDEMNVIRWDAVGNSWALTDDSTITQTGTIQGTFDVIHEPTNGDAYIVKSNITGTPTTLGEIDFYFYDESADTVTALGTKKLTAVGTAGNSNAYPRLALDVNNNTLVCAFMWGPAVTTTAPAIMTSFDGGVTFGDPLAIVRQGQDDFRWPSQGYHIIDEALGTHIVYLNDDLDDVHSVSYVLDRITGNVVDNSDVAAPSVDCLIFAIDPGDDMSRVYLGRAISDASGDWTASIFVPDESNVEIQVIYDENLANDEVDVSHRLAVDSF